MKLDPSLPRPTRWLATAALVLVLAANGIAQESPPGPPTLEEVKAKQDEIAGLDLTDEVKQSLADKLDRAATELQNASGFREQETEFRQAAGSAPEELEQLARKSKELTDALGTGGPLTESGRELGPDELQSLLDAERNAAERARAELDEIKAAVAAGKLRPTALPDEIDAARETLSQARSAGQDTRAADGGESPGRLADRWLASAQAAAAQARIDMLEQEQLSSATRMRVLEARQELAELELARADARLGKLREQVSRQAEEVASDAAETAREVRASGAADDPDGSRADALEAWSQELREVGEHLGEAQAEQEQVIAASEQLAGNFELARRQVEVGTDGAVAQSLLDQKRALPEPRRLEAELKRQGERLRQIRVDRLRIENSLRTLPKPGSPEEDELTAAERQVIEELNSQYDRLVDALVQLEVRQRAYIDEVRNYADFLAEKLFWVRSAPPFGLESVRDLPDAFAWLAGPSRGAGPGTLLGRLRDAPRPLVIGALLLAALLWPRRRLRAMIERTGKDVRRVSTDRYSHTLKVLGASIVLALPVPALLYLVGSRLAAVSFDSPWALGIASGLMIVARPALIFTLLREILRPGGLAEAHFRWRKTTVERFRGSIGRIAVLYFPMLFLLVALLGEETGSHFHSLGRLGFIVAMLWAAWWAARMMRPSDGVLSGYAQDHPTGAIARMRRLLFVLVVLAPVILAVMAAAGYFFTAAELFGRFQATAILILIGLFAYELLLRASSIRERKLALEQRIAEREARREAALHESEGDEPATAEETAFVEAEQDEIDLVEVGTQTRRLLRAITGAAVIGMLWLSWSSALPALRGLDATPVLGSASLADLLLAVLILVATIVVSGNLPGLLEITILRKITGDAGLRYAVNSIAQYVIIAVGVVSLFQVLGLDWAQFGWIFAALSVGLGFGLQEVVANFICGLLLLFERPIRVGDIATIGDVTGTVSKIRIRATTLTDWDRKEYIVPNKELITGRVLNWTLDGTTNRLVLNFGVAYGTDTDRVCEVVKEVLAAHPDILKDPAPLVTFENFGESSLDFVIRCYLPTLDRRLGVTHELLSEIHRRFIKEKIEIPFPQRDLNLRHVDPSVSFGANPASAPAQS